LVKVLQNHIRRYGWREELTLAHFRRSVHWFTSEEVPMLNASPWEMKPLMRLPNPHSARWSFPKEIPFHMSRGHVSIGVEIPNPNITWSSKQYFHSRGTENSDCCSYGNPLTMVLPYNEPKLIGGICFW
jgi:hypothetical protein